MMTMITHCYKCRELLDGFGSPASYMYEVICETYALTDHPLIIEIGPINENMIQVVDFLESKGFVISTDVDNVIMVKPTYMEKLGQSLCFFCSDIVKHSIVDGENYV